MNLFVLRFFWLAVVATLLPLGAQAQYFINQTAMEDILTECPANLRSMPEVHYDYFVLYSSRNNNVLARNNLYKVIGEGDLELGQRRARLVEMINRKLVEFTNIGDTLVVPSRYDLNFCAYSPFPRYYNGASGIDKLFIIDKALQAFAAYENGQLRRWGIVNTGAAVSPTPNGRFNFNWREEHRVSSLSPPGEPWDMYWVLNFHNGRGIHIHQYAMPTGGPRSHGCVRMIDEDAQWMYNWADTWQTTLGNGFGSDRGKILKQGSMVLVLNEDPTSAPSPFTYGERYPEIRTATLPDDPWSIPPGTEQQRQFDKKRVVRGGR